MQRGRAGLKSSRPKAVRKLNGDLSNGEFAKMATIHFNTASIYSLELVDSLPFSDVCSDFPSLDEIRTTLSLVAGNKAGGIMVKVCSDELLMYLLDLFTDSESVPQEWRNASLVPVPKNGDLSSCGN